jgi:hypothetical protein
MVIIAALAFKLGSSHLGQARDRDRDPDPGGDRDPAASH